LISPFRQYPQGHQDVLNSLLQGGQADNDLQAAKRHADLGQQARDWSQKYALQGLQNHVDLQSQRNNLWQSRIDGIFGPVGNILRGLGE